MMLPMAKAIISRASASGTEYSNSSRTLRSDPNFSVSLAALPSLMRMRIDRSEEMAR